MSGDVFRDAAYQESIQARLPVGANHNEVGLPVRSIVGDSDSGVAILNPRQRPETRLAQEAHGACD